MSKKTYILFANAISDIDNESLREQLINFLSPILSDDNAKFSEERFKAWINKKLLERLYKEISL